MPSNELKAKRYLGDGVYAGWDGLNIVLWLESESFFGPNHIALEPDVMTALFRYQAALGRRIWSETPDQI